jgi:alpha-glucosidase
MAALASARGALAQDERRVASPDGQIEFRVFLTQPQPAAPVRLAYQVSFRGQRLINTSFLGLEVHDQSLLGENVGIVTSKAVSAGGYNGLTAEYMQNGSLGRRINLEVRVYNDGIAFRYAVPPSGPLERMSLENEATEFEFVRSALVDPGRLAIAKIPLDAVIALPFVTEQPGLGWVSVTELREGIYPPMSVRREGGEIMISRLPPGSAELHLAWEGPTPFTGPWRILIIGPTRTSVTESELASRLKR